MTFDTIMRACTIKFNIGYLSLLFPFAEDGCADTHHRRAFFYCHFKVMAHAHRQLGQPARSLSAVIQLIEYLAQTAKVRPSLLRLVKERRHRHQPFEIEMLCRVQCLHDASQFRFISARLSRFVSEINLRERRKPSTFFACYAVESLGKLAAINRVNHVEGADRKPRFVRLQMAYQMPSEMFAFYRLDFACGLLNAILAQIERARIYRSLNC